MYEICLLRGAIATYAYRLGCLRNMILPLGPP